MVDAIPPAAGVDLSAAPTGGTPTGGAPPPLRTVASVGSAEDVQQWAAEN